MSTDLIEAMAKVIEAEKEFKKHLSPEARELLNAVRAAHNAAEERHAKRKGEIERGGRLTRHRLSI